VKEARYLIRIASSGLYQPSDQAALSVQVRALAGPIKGKTINLRVTAHAIEFDLFCDAAAPIDSYVSVFEKMGPVVTRKRLDLPPVHQEAQTLATEARHLFNEQRFWEVHEVLEGLWKERQGDEKRLVQGLILMAAALVHAQKNEMAVLWSMMKEALARLKDQPPVYYGWDIAKFREHFARILADKKLEIPTV
jgi:hypothetical protein